MKITDLYKIAVSLDLKEREHWLSILQDSLKAVPAVREEAAVAREDSSAIREEIIFEDFITALYVSAREEDLISSTVAIAYGAGNIAKEYLPQIQTYIKVSEIWDAYAGTGSLYGIPVVRPDFDSAGRDIPVIVLIEDSAVRCDLASLFESKGYSMVYFYREFIRIMRALSSFPHIGGRMTEQTKKLLDSFISQYTVLDNEYAPVNYSVVPDRLAGIKLDMGHRQFSVSEICERLSALLLLRDADRGRTNQYATGFVREGLRDAFCFACQMELFLRQLLADGVKTAERPIRMHGDKPYDPFAVSTAVKVILDCICCNDQKALSVIRLLRTLSPYTVPLMSVECYYLAKCRYYEAALELSRNAMRKEPNGLLSNEMFYQTAVLCREQGIVVDEPLPDYDLSTRFCWSGLTFALCSGFDNKDGSAEFLPCFRTLQCAADPAGDFWTGEQWIEFRKSILDGSFRYCQKNQCSNIVAGWLPKKSECNHEQVRRLISGDLSAVMPLEELHFSYDFHCNLKCPSCRLEIKSNHAEQNSRLDRLFEKNLRPLVKRAKHLCLSGCGEAVISPHSRKLLQSLSREEYPELAVELRTNVYSLNPRTWNALGDGRKVIRHVAASIDAASKELFERIRFPAQWDTVLKNLEFIQSLRNSGEIDLFEFHVVVQTDNIDELADIIQMAVNYDADAITFSRLVNWRGMSEEEYHAVNPFWPDHPQHEKLMRVIMGIIRLRDEIESGSSRLTEGRKKLMINMHCVPDPNAAYDRIRTGRLKIR